MFDTLVSHKNRYFLLQHVENSFAIKPRNGYLPGLGWGSVPCSVAGFLRCFEGFFSLL